MFVSAIRNRPLLSLALVLALLVCGFWFARPSTHGGHVRHAVVFIGPAGGSAGNGNDSQDASISSSSEAVAVAILHSSSSSSGASHSHSHSHVEHGEHNATEATDANVNETEIKIAEEVQNPASGKPELHSSTASASVSAATSTSTSTPPSPPNSQVSKGANLETVNTTTASTGRDSELNDTTSRDVEQHGKPKPPRPERSVLVCSYHNGGCDPRVSCSDVPANADANIANTTATVDPRASVVCGPCPDGLMFDNRSSSCLQPSAQQSCHGSWQRSVIRVLSDTELQLLQTQQQQQQTAERQRQFEKLIDAALQDSNANATLGNMTMNAGDSIHFALFAINDKGVLCEEGGDVWYARLATVAKYKASSKQLSEVIVSPQIRDFRNGVYLLSFKVVDAGVYRCDVRLDVTHWQRNERWYRSKHLNESGQCVVQATKKANGKAAWLRQTGFFVDVISTSQSKPSKLSPCHTMENPAAQPGRLVNGVWTPFDCSYDIPTNEECIFSQQPPRKVLLIGDSYSGRFVDWMGNLEPWNRNGLLHMRSGPIFLPDPASLALFPKVWRHQWSPRYKSSNGDYHVEDAHDHWFNDLIPKLQPSMITMSVGLHILQPERETLQSYRLGLIHCRDYLEEQAKRYPNTTFFFLTTTAVNSHATPDVHCLQVRSICMCVRASKSLTARS